MPRVEESSACALGNDVQWATVGEQTIAYVTESVKNRRKHLDVDGYRELSWADVPLRVQENAEQYRWSHFGMVGDTLVAGPNKNARLKAARAVQQTFGGNFAEERR